MVPFVAKVLESCADSQVFKPPNPWTMAIMSVLSELHAVPDLKVSFVYIARASCLPLYTHTHTLYMHTHTHTHTYIHTRTCTHIHICTHIAQLEV